MLHHPLKPRTKQLSLFMPPAPAHRSETSATPNAKERGAVFTRRETVDFILDLSGYTTDKPLHSFRLLEPSFGRGDFLLPVVAIRWRQLINSIWPTKSRIYQLAAARS